MQKRKKTNLQQGICARLLRPCLVLVLLVSALPVTHAASVPGCYQTLGLDDPRDKVNALYVLVDQTTYLSQAMKENIAKLVSDWGRHGDRVRVLRFSANVKGQFTELMFEETLEAIPSDAYLFHLRDADRDSLLKCLQDNKRVFAEQFANALRQTLVMTRQTLPKTDLLYNLQQITSKTMHNDDEKHQTILIVSDGLENSDYLRFHGKGKINRINTRKSINTLKKNKLVSNWRKADIYMYGLGHISNPEHYARPKLIERLKEFWTAYFEAGKGNLIQLGTPEILLSTLR